MSAKHILLVDDDEPCLRLMEELLVRRGFRVRTAGTRSDALQLFDASPDHFDLLVTDLVLSGTERGHELAWQLTARDPALRVLLVSAHADSAQDLAGAIPSPSAFVEKPFDLDAFVQAVEQLLAEEPVQEELSGPSPAPQASERTLS